MRFFFFLKIQLRDEAGLCQPVSFHRPRSSHVLIPGQNTLRRQMNDIIELKSRYVHTLCDCDDDGV